MDNDHGFSKACPSGNKMTEDKLWAICERCGATMPRATRLCEDCMTEEIGMEDSND